MRVTEIAESIRESAPLVPGAEAGARPSPVPAAAGVYAWFFENVPTSVPVNDTDRREGASLLYLGIAPSRERSSSNLRKRLRSHLRGNASGSTLRLTLGCLLAEDLGIQLEPTGKSGRLTFGAGEGLLSSWIEENARLVWVVVDQPWLVEKELISRFSLPLNLEFNSSHPFHATLRRLRRDARHRARS